MAFRIEGGMPNPSAMSYGLEVWHAVWPPHIALLHARLCASRSNSPVQARKLSNSQRSCHTNRSTLFAVRVSACIPE